MARRAGVGITWHRGEYRHRERRLGLRSAPPWKAFSESLALDALESLESLESLGG